MAVDIEAHLRVLAVQIDRLKVLYEQYFIGIEKAAPVVPRREVEKLLVFLSLQTIGNTGLRFRHQGLVRRWKTYVERWDKVLREMENGTYARHVARARLRALPAPDGKPGGPEAAGGEAGADAAKRPAVQAAVAPAAVPGMSDDELRVLHQRYVEALRSTGDGRGVKFEGLVASLRKQVPELLKKSQCTELSFDVALKDGKVVLRATPKR